MEETVVGKYNKFKVEEAFDEFEVYDVSEGMNQKGSNRDERRKRKEDERRKRDKYLDEMYGY